MKKQTKSCNCIEDCNKELAKQGLKLDTDFEFNFTTGQANLAISIKTKKLPTNTSRKKPLVLACSYCPFCGKKQR